MPHHAVSEKGLDFDTANGKGIFVSSKAGPHQMVNTWEILMFLVVSWGQRYIRSLPCQSFECLGLPKGIREHIQGLSGYLEAFGTEVIRFVSFTLARCI